MYSKLKQAMAKKGISLSDRMDHKDHIKMRDFFYMTGTKLEDYVDHFTGGAIKDPEQAAKARAEQVAREEAEKQEAERIAAEQAVQKEAEESAAQEAKAAEEAAALASQQEAANNAPAENTQSPAENDQQPQDEQPAA